MKILKKILEFILRLFKIKSKVRGNCPEPKIPEEEEPKTPEKEEPKIPEKEEKVKRKVIYMNGDTVVGEFEFDPDEEVYINEQLI